MVYDEKFKERVKAEDSVDRLAELKTRLDEERKSSARFRDDIRRLALLVGVGLIVVYAALAL